ncbi:sodium channel subunit beta-1 [Conger conger]|uniref:sodium channel subunit beta-1 n=1 Tax=Conger conger TaxID=82655 RepID=UPI002A59C53E|nr:sodium channel subunit beta-1 [Conger conger]
MSLLLLSTFLLSIVCVPGALAGCAEVVSMTEAVAGQGFLLGCISCKRREEVPASTSVDWFFKPLEAEDFYQIFHYEHPTSTVLHEDFEERLEWHGTKGTTDVQIGALWLSNVTYNDTGTYRCSFERILELSDKERPEEKVLIHKEVELTVVAEANRELVSVIAEVMMYVLIVVLQLWLIGVLVHCYRKIWAEREAFAARRALRHPAIPDSKDNCDGVLLE